MIYGKEVWGPKAWNLLHSFSIIYLKKKLSIKTKKKYHDFYHAFIYILQCLECSEHYTDIVLNKNPLHEQDITREYLLKWVFRTHNIVNDELDKPNYKYSDFLKQIKNDSYINHNSIFFVLRAIYINFIDYNVISLYKYDQIYTFFICFCYLYPEKDRRIKLKKLIKTDDFEEILTPLDFKNWLKTNIAEIKAIIV